jgi:hypothetical protein
MNSEDAISNTELENIKYTDTENGAECSSKVSVPNYQNSVKSQKTDFDWNVLLHTHSIWTLMAS